MAISTILYMVLKHKIPLKCFISFYRNSALKAGKNYRSFDGKKAFEKKMLLWLNQFDVLDRSFMLNFIVKNLDFVSEKDIEKSAKEAIERVYKTSENNYDLKQTIFMGLTDGARMDLLRYISNGLDNHQFCMDYEISDKKIMNILRKLDKESCDIKGKSKDIRIHLVDDFSGSGISYFRFENGLWKGKLKRFMDSIYLKFSNKRKVYLFLYLYYASSNAVEYIQNIFKMLYPDVEFKIEVINVVKKISLNKKEEEMLQKYFDDELLNDKNYLKGICSKPYLGFNEASLCTVFYHNAPNNCFPIIWYGKNALFPRKNRHLV